MARPAPTGPSATRGRPQIGIGYHGDLPDELWGLLAECHAWPPSVASNIAREHAVLIALAASLGWLSVVDLDGKGFSRTWRLTPEGGFALRNKGHGT